MHSGSGGRVCTGGDTGSTINMERQSTGTAGVMRQNRGDLDHAGVFAVGAVAQATARTVFGLDAIVRRRLACLSLFWHFLDLVWICVFTIVYLREFL